MALLSVFVNHGNLGISSFEESFELHEIEPLRYQQNGIAGLLSRYLIINPFPKLLGKQVKSLGINLGK